MILAAALSVCTAAATAKGDAGPPLDNYFTPASKTAVTTDEEGFIRRWNHKKNKICNKKNSGVTQVIRNFAAETIIIEHETNLIIFVCGIDSHCHKGSEH